MNRFRFHSPLYRALLGGAVLTSVPFAALASPVDASNSIHTPSAPTRNVTMNIDGPDIAYREAGDPKAPKLVLMDFCASNHRSRKLADEVPNGLNVIAPAAAAPIYPPFGLDRSAVDPATKAGDDFFQYANGAYLRRIAIPADRPSYSRVSELFDRIEGQLHNLLDEAARGVGVEPTDTRGKVGAFYAAFMDEAAVEARGSKAIAPELAAIRAADRSELAALMGTPGFYAAPFSYSIDADLKEPNRYVTSIGQADLSLPDRDYYLKPAFAAQRKAYRDYAQTLLKLLGWADSAKAADSVLALETRLAEAGWTKVQQRDPTVQYNPMTPAELAAMAPGFDWKRYLAAGGLGGKRRLIVTTNTAMPKLAAIIGATPLDELRAWMVFHVADAAAPYLPKAFADARFELRDHVLAGQTQQKPRWKLGIRAVAGGDCGADPSSCFGTLDWGVGQMYAARYFPPATKARITSLVMNLKAAFRKRIERVDWMSPETRTEALAKLDSYVIKVGYPDKWRDYSSVVIRRDDLVGNVRNAVAADWDFFVQRSDGPVDRGDWQMTPQTIDAYSGSLLDIVFPAGILQAPSFDALADPAINYGAIGAIIGHELTHGFDDQGRSIDAKGALRNWWTPADAAKFKERAAVLGAQYALYEPVPGVHINSDLTMGENLADLGGLTIALDAYHVSLNDKPASVVGGLTGDQRVFLGWAQVWAGKTKPEEILRQTISDSHSFRKFRVNGVVRNLDGWYTAFGITPGDTLYIPPERRARIW